jgi:predicted metalloendopeptidase
MRLSSPFMGLLFVALLATPSKAAPAPRGVEPAFMDTTVSPCTDFFRFANGRWYDAAIIPPSYTAIGTGREMFDRNSEVLHRVLENARAGAEVADNPSLQRIGGYYGTCMDSARADREGATPIAGRLARIAAMRATADLVGVVASLHQEGVDALFQFDSEADPKQASRVIGQLSQGGFGLPDREYYTKTDSASAALRAEYVAHIVRTLVLTGAGEPDARAQAKAAMAIETALARASMTNVERRDPNAVYHKMTVAELTALAPAWRWSHYFTAVGVPALARRDASLDVSMPAFVKRMNGLVRTTPIADWKAYLRWRVADATSTLLGQAFVDESFRFTSKLSGARALQPRWRRCIGATDAGLGEALGQVYVATEFPPAAKARMLEMVQNLQATMLERINGLTWMSDATKVQARRKLTTTLFKIGYPDTWRDYGTLVVDPHDSFAANVLRARAFEVRRQLDKIGRPLDRAEWQMTPPTVNAYSESSINEIVFPAGILQAPKFSLSQDDASNYGQIGSVIGHEFTHGFDDEGRQFDADGNLKDWWSAEDAKQFTARADEVAKLYDSFVSIDTLHVNGRLTLGENIADLGGLTISYHAFQKAMAGKPRTLINGFTPEQRFFIAFAQGWRAKLRPEALQVMTRTNPHSPPYWRVNGVMMNMPEFAEAFGCAGGTPMSKPAGERTVIW